MYLQIKCLHDWYINELVEFRKDKLYNVIKIKKYEYADKIMAELQIISEYNNIFTFYSEQSFAGQIFNVDNFCDNLLMKCLKDYSVGNSNYIDFYKDKYYKIHAMNIEDDGRIIITFVVDRYKNCRQSFWSNDHTYFNIIDGFEKINRGDYMNG